MIHLGFSSVGTTIGRGPDGRGIRFDSCQGQGIYLVSTVSIPALGPTKTPIKWALSPGTEWPGREASHSPRSSTKVKMHGAVPLFHCKSSWRGFYLIKHKDNFYDSQNEQCLYP
jgi:hypothetical protein